MITMLSKRDEAFIASGDLDLVLAKKIGRQWIPEAMIEKQKLFLEHMLAKRKKIE